MDTQLQRLLLDTSAEPDRITELLQAMALRLSQPEQAEGVGAEAALQDFQLALNLAEKLCQTAADKFRLESVLNNMPMAMLELGPDLSVRGTNQQAQRLLDAGVFLRRQGHSVICDHELSQQRLEELVAQYSVPRAEPLPPAVFNLASVSDPGHLVPCYLYQQSQFDLERQQAVHHVCLLLNENANATPGQNVSAYAQHHGLTAGETEILTLLTNGLSVNEVAKQRCKSVHTVRTQVKGILAKTRAGRQSNLILQARQFVAAGAATGAALQPQSGAAQRFTLSDGRQITYSDSGGPSDQVVVHCHGMFTCRLDPVDHQVFRQRGLRLIIPDRPGYGLSDPLPNHSLLDWAGDLLELLEGLGIDRCTLLAADFSSAFALAVACRAPQRVRDVILLEGAAPVDSRLERYEATMPVYYKAVFLVARRMPKLIHKATYVAYAHFSRDPEKALHRFIDIIGQDNSRVVREPHIYPQILTAVRESIRQGISALSATQILLFSDWGFALSAVRCPVYLVCGDADPLASYHRARLEDALVQPVLLPLAGQGWAGMLYREIDAVLDQWMEHRIQHLPFSM
ncbi:MAG: hypothetical protein CML06_11575 [Pseudomonadales bacterium]|nr:hypothetical protein [Pseudomonadales bacterium]